MMSKITLGEPHLSCGMMMENSNCGDEYMEGHHCCDNQYTNVDLDDNFAKTSFDLQLNPNFVAAFFSIFVLQQVENYDQNLDYFTDYFPPPLEEDLLVLYETFLI